MDCGLCAARKLFSISGQRFAQISFWNLCPELHPLKTAGPETRHKPTYSPDVTAPCMLLTPLSPFNRLKFSATDRTLWEALHHVLHYDLCRKPFSTNTASSINLQTPNVIYSWRVAPLTSKVVFYIFIQQIYVPNILNMVYTVRFFSSKCSLFHNSNVFGSCIIHISLTGCAKRLQKVNHH